jgi:3-methyladenine DNA glycosylase AlkD
VTANRALIEAVRAGLEGAADAERALRMQQYMKSDMPFYGVPAPAQRVILREAFGDHPLASAEDWRDTVAALWREATHREERYAAIELAKRGSYRRFRDRDALPLYEEMVVTGAWWDYDDTIASNLLGELLASDREWMSARMRRWARDPQLWKRRAAILSQLKRREATDTALLEDCIAPNFEDRDFFIRKAIGWALRQYAKHDPDWVRSCVAAHEGELSGLSRREAMKHLS